jgi:hypothetical protein
MKTFTSLLFILTLSCTLTLSYTLTIPQKSPAEDAPPENPLIDYRGFLENAAQVQKLRAERRLTEADFLRMTAEPNTIIFDARSDSKFALLHIKNARHLSLPDHTAAELAKIIPAKSTRVLIYCNNNFQNEPTALPTKAIATSLNIYTFNTLHSYGYTNIYELGPLIDINQTQLPFEGSLVPKTK